MDDDDSIEKIYGEFEEWLNTPGKDYTEEDMKKFIRHKGYEPKGWDTEIPDYDDLMDILNENGWGTRYIIELQEEEDEYGNSINFQSKDKRGLLNNLFGYSQEIFTEDLINKHEWFINGVRHRLGKPAVTAKFLTTQEPISDDEERWEYGKQVV
jgi:hypothetical protein